MKKKSKDFYFPSDLPLFWEMVVRVSAAVAVVGLIALGVYLTLQIAAFIEYVITL